MEDFGGGAADFAAGEALNFYECEFDGGGGFAAVEEDENLCGDEFARTGELWCDDGDEAVRTRGIGGVGGGTRDRVADGGFDDDYECECGGGGGNV